MPSPPPPLEREDLEPMGTAETDTCLITVSPPKLLAFGRGRPVKLVRQRSSSSSPGPSNESADQTMESPPRFTLNVANISESDLGK